ncbi:MAG: hypothetical protein JNJ57_06100, partial [Saprospiraceae bacterium]|nr:hypothetical protein [Saprospiraceae bacterium]
IQTMVADNMEELIKLLPYKSSVKLLIRISFPNPEARCDLSSKFGASLEQGRQLISFCLQQGIQLAGCSFHAGSQLPGPEAMLFAISQIKQLYNWCASELNYTMAVLNIGGGFPAKLSHSIPDLSTFCAPIHDLLNELFPDTEIWSEPGRCLATDCMTHISSVIGKSIRHGKKWYYLDDGVYGTFSGKIYDHAEYQHQPLEAETDTALAPSVLAGPTCDSIDVLKEMVLLPELKVGDLIITPQIGAYGWASRTQFNHLKSAAIIESDLLEMKEFASSSLRWTSLAGNPSFKSSPELELELSQITAN